MINKFRISTLDAIAADRHARGNALLILECPNDLVRITRSQFPQSWATGLKRNPWLNRVAILDSLTDKELWDQEARLQRHIGSYRVARTRLYNISFDQVASRLIPKVRPLRLKALRLTSSAFEGLLYSNLETGPEGQHFWLVMGRPGPNSLFRFEVSPDVFTHLERLQSRA